MSKSEEKVFTVSGELQEDMTIKLDYSTALRRLFTSFFDKKLEIKICALRYKRSDAQNRYIHGIVVPCIRAWFKETQGELKSHDEIYTWLRVGLLDQKPEISEILGNQVIVMTGKRFSNMNTKEFSEAINTIVQKMDEKGCYIPLPKENNLLSDFVKN